MRKTSAIIRKSYAKKRNDGMKSGMTVIKPYPDFSTELDKYLTNEDKLSLSGTSKTLYEEQSLNKMYNFDNSKRFIEQFIQLSETEKQQKIKKMKNHKIFL